LLRINGNKINDVLDYKFYSYDARLLLELKGAEGKLKLVRLRKPEGVDIGLEFDSFLMDAQRACTNKCIFCFIDQLPRGMRKSLYYKDDDVRLSFLQGNYITLTNLSPIDIERIIKLRISPVNVSVHTLDANLRSLMLGTPKAAAGIDALKVLAAAGITLNCQIVICPRINDGANLSKTLRGFISLGPSVNSVSIVPVGLTKHREGLTQIAPVSRELALKTIKLAGSFGELCLRRRGKRVFFCADEMYMKAGLMLPQNGFYEDYPQLENGVGMMRLFITEFEEALRRSLARNTLGSGDDHHYNSHPGLSSLTRAQQAAPLRNKGLTPRSQCKGMTPHCSFSVATGVAACKYLTNLLNISTDYCDRIVGKVYAVRNDFFGASVTVSGLVTGGDIIKQLRGRELGERLLIPQNMLRHGDDVFLDDVTVPQVSDALGVPVVVVRVDGGDFFRAIYDL